MGVLIKNKNRQVTDPGAEAVWSPSLKMKGSRGWVFPNKPGVQRVGLFPRSTYLLMSPKYTKLSHLGTGYSFCLGRLRSPLQTLGHPSKLT